MNKKDILILDIETYSEADINQEFDKYVETAKVKWIGFYSYNSEKYHEIEVLGNENLVIEFIRAHKFIITFNGDDFDIPILKNNNLWPEGYKISGDLKKILSSNILWGKKRGELMGYKYKKDKLKIMSKVMGTPVEKGDIDYMIFKKDIYSDDEKTEIKKYLRIDIELTKFLFDKVYNFWLPFSNFISEKNRDKYCWITSSIASVVYKTACNIMNWPETYGEKGEKTKGGGRTIEPRVEEAWDVWYLDVTSLYPHIYAMFSLLCEVNAETEKAWHGNQFFKVEGYYDISKPHKLALDMMQKLKTRLKLKKEDPTNGLIYAYKIYLNTFYGTNRSKVFENLYTPNSGKDCCYLGRQINRIMETMMDNMGYTTIAGDTDSVFVQYRDGIKTYDEVKESLKMIVAFINTNVPFPQETFNIDIEKKIDYIMYVKEEGKKAKKKNYAYVYSKKDGSKHLIVMGLPIIKTNSTKLGPLILEKHIKPRMIKELRGKFEKSWMEKLIKEELEKDLGLMLIEYKSSAYTSYKFLGRSCLTAQISKHYLNEKSGIISLIKNKRIGRVGGAFKYCTLEESKDLDISDLDLKKVYNELSPFVNGGLEYNPKKITRNNIQGFFK